MMNRKSLVIAMLLASPTVAWQPTPPNRRAFLGQLVGASGSLALVTSTPRIAVAKDELFRPNPLTNRVLEQIRIREQAEADNMKYGGELEGGDTGKKTSTSAYASLLVPILEIAAELETVDRILRKEDRKALGDIGEILQQSKYDKVQFKKTFNAYGDNIYYSDPDRANVYLGGGATPKTEQTLAYLMRNEILTNVEDMRAEVSFLLKNTDESTEELLKLSNNALAAIRKYLEVVPPAELVEARNALKAQSS